jgi:hypothetical protein
VDGVLRFSRKVGTGHCAPNEVPTSPDNLTPFRVIRRSARWSRSRPPTPLQLWHETAGMSEEDKPLVMRVVGLVPCRPVAGHRHPDLALEARLRFHHGSTKARCLGCDCEVWVSPDNLELVESSGVRVICDDCVYDLIEVAKTREYGDPTLN